MVYAEKIVEKYSTRKVEATHCSGRYEQQSIT